MKKKCALIIFFAKNVHTNGGKMSIYKDQLAQSVHDLKLLKKKYTHEYGTCLPGTLVRCTNREKQYYYHRTNDNGKILRKSIEESTATIKALARKEFLKRAIEAIDKDLKLLEKANSGFEDIDIDRLKALMSNAYKSLPNEYFYDTDLSTSGIYSSERYKEAIERHREWAKSWYEKSSFRPEKLRFPTSAGFNVRSKSEQHIVEQLVNYGVPFRYEQVIHIDNLLYSADFTFRDKNMKNFYWEHAGMMDDPIYVEGYYKKRSSFESVGIVPWKNLIITYDNDGVISIPVIKGVIENEVLPRL